MIAERYTIQPMKFEDLDEVIAIERELFLHPWSRGFFELVIMDKNNCMITVKVESKIIGYGGSHFLNQNSDFWIIKKKYRSVVHIINVAVRREFQRRGFGTIIVDTLLNDAVKRGAEFAYLEVRPSNGEAIRLYRKFGFMIIGIIENYYPQEKEDALVMGLDLK